MRNQEWDSTFAQLHPLDLCQLVFRLFAGDAVDCEAALCVVDKSEVLCRLFDRDNVHESGRISGVCADLAVNLDEALHNDGLGFAGVESILQSERNQWDLIVTD